MIKEEIAHINGIPKNLIVFLHGYQDCAEHIDRKTVALREIPDSALHIPQAPFISEIDPLKRQWFSMHQFDPEDRRRNIASWDEFIEFYNRMTVGLEQANHYILEYVDNLLSEYNLGYENLFLCGFSQGAMCAIYSALMCPYKIGGVVSFSGILAAKGYVAQHCCSFPDFFLIHGAEDDKVRFSALAFTKQNLEKLGCSVEVFAAKEVPHKIVSETVAAAESFIKKRIK